MLEEVEDGEVEQESSLESQATTVVEEVLKPHGSLVDETNPMGPIEPTPELVKKVFQPAGYYQPENFELMQLEAEENQESFGELKLRLKTAEGTTLAARDRQIKIVPVAGLTNSTTASADSSTRALQ